MIDLRSLTEEEQSLITETLSADRRAAASLREQVTTHRRDAEAGQVTVEMLRYVTHLLDQVLEDSAEFPPPPGAVAAHGRLKVLLHTLQGGGRGSA